MNSWDMVEMRKLKTRIAELEAENEHVCVDDPIFTERLVRAEAENERLRDKQKRDIDLVVEQSNDLARAEAENERLRAQVQNLTPEVQERHSFAHKKWKECEAENERLRADFTLARKIRGLCCC